jgi:hypothetical protein
MSAVSPKARAAWSFKAVGIFVPKATARAREAHGLHAADIILNWPAIVGPALAAYTAPRRIRWARAPDRLPSGVTAQAPKPLAKTGGKGALTSKGLSAAQKTTLEIWVAGGRGHEIPYLKAQILNRINAYFGYRAITDLLPVDGPMVRPQVAVKRTPPKPEEIAAVAAQLSLPSDDPLAQSLAKLGANIARKARERR